MPTYEYRCKDCGHEFDAVQAFTDDALTECPTCGGALRKVFGNVGITFKGSGFYKNDSRSGGKEKAGDAGSSTKESSEKAGGDKASGDKAGSDKGGGDKAGAGSSESSGSKSSGSGTKESAGAGTSTTATKSA